MSSATHEAKQKFLAHLGTSAPHVQMAIDVDPMARMIFDHVVTYIAGILPQQGLVHPDTGKRIFEAGFDVGAKLSIERFNRNSPPDFKVVRDQAWYLFKETGDAGTFAEPRQPIEFPTKPRSGHLAVCASENCPGCGTDFWNAEQKVVTPLVDSDAPAKPPCQHSFRYTGTDGHGSHKGESHYKCIKCDYGEYRHD